MRKLYEKRDEYEEQVLKFISDNFDDYVMWKMPDSKGILHGYEVLDSDSGEHLTIGWDYIWNQVMYIRTCQPLMFDAIETTDKEEK